MSMKRRTTDLEKAVLTDLPDSARIQVLAPGESAEERKAALTEKYRDVGDIIFIRIKGRDA